MNASGSSATSTLAGDGHFLPVRGLRIHRSSIIHDCLVVVHIFLSLRPPPLQILLNPQLFFLQSAFLRYIVGFPRSAFLLLFFNIQ